MKVVYFIHCFFPKHFYGSETYTLNVAQHMRQAGHDVYVVSAKFPGETVEDDFLTRYEYKGIPVYCFDKNKLPHTRIKDTYYQEGMRQPLKDLLVELSPDIIHVVHLINHTAVLLEVIRELNIPVIATFTDFFGFCFNNKLQAANGDLCFGPDASRSNCLACYLKASSASQASKIVRKLTCTTPWVKWLSAIMSRIVRMPWFSTGSTSGIVSDIRYRPDILHSCYQAYWAAIAPSSFLEKAYLRNGFNRPLHLQHFGVDIDRSTKPLRGEGEAIKFGYIGQLASHKGVDILLKAFKGVPNAELHIYGPADQDKGYMDLLTQESDRCHSMVCFDGTFPPEKMAEIMADLDFLVIPSRWYENSPLALLNALATHTPVIVSDVEGMTEFVKKGVNGYVFPLEDAAALEVILNNIAKNPMVARSLSKTTHYDRSNCDMVQGVLDLYNRILKSTNNSLKNADMTGSK